MFGEDAKLRFEIGAVAIADAAGDRRIELAALPVNAAGFVVEVVETFDPPTTPLDENGQGEPYAVFGSGAHLAEIEVDVELGRVKVLRLVCAHDVGRAINPTLVEGQIEGGAAQGLGLALMEEFFPGKGENLHDYLIPTIGDMPPVECILIEDGSSAGPFGAKGIGEQALIPTAPAIFNAIHHATGAPDSARACDPGPRASAHSGGRSASMTEADEKDPLRRLPGDVLHPARDDGRVRPLRERRWPIRAGRSACAARPRRQRRRKVVPSSMREGAWNGDILETPGPFVTAVGAGTTYPDYKPAPFIVSSRVDGVDMVTVVTEGIYSYCGVKVKIDTDRHLGAECAIVRAEGEPVGHVTTGEYGSQMLSLGGVNHLTHGGKKEGRVTCETLLVLSNRKSVELVVDGGASVIVQAGKAPIINGKLEERMRVGCGSATIGMFAKQWGDKVDEVVVVDDHITGVLSEHQAGKLLGMRDTGIKMKGRRSTPGRYFHVAPSARSPTPRTPRA